MAKSIDEIIKELKDTLKKQNVDDDLIKGIEDLLSKVSGNKDNTKKDIEELAEFLGRVARAGATGVGGGEAVALGEIAEILKPALQKLIERLVESILGTADGYKKRKDPTDPHSVEKIKKTSGLDLGIIDEDDGSAPRISLQNGSKEITCKKSNPNLVQVKFKVNVRRVEEDVEEIKASIIGVDGISIEGHDTISEGSRNLPDTSDQSSKNNKWSLDMVLCIPCDAILDNLGVFILRLDVTDDDGNAYIYHTEIYLREVLLSDEYKCCKAARREDFIEELVKKVRKKISGLDKEKIREIIDELLKDENEEKKVEKDKSPEKEKVSDLNEPKKADEDKKTE